MADYRIKVTLALLNHNDLEGLRTVLPRVERKIFCEVFAVDGGSTDGSLNFLRESDFPVYVQPSGGRGGAIRLAVEKAKGDYIVFLSSDGEEDPRDLPKFLECFGLGADMVIASRLKAQGSHKADQEPGYLPRKLYLQFFTKLVNIFFRGSVTDCWNGYRGFRISFFHDLRLDAEGFLLEAQQTIRFLKRGGTLLEFPTREGVRPGGRSGNPILKTGLLHLMMLVKERLS